MSKVEVTTPLTHAGLRNKSKEWLIDTLVLAGNANAWNEQAALKAQALNGELLVALKRMVSNFKDSNWTVEYGRTDTKMLALERAYAVIAKAEGRL